MWVATHVITRAQVAIKFLRPEYANKVDVVHRFIREARAAIAVRHPNVVAIHDVLQLEDGTPAMVMDYLRGESLANKLSREHKLPVETAARLIVPALSAVAAAHALGIVHRDLKPDNLFIAADGEGASVKVLDFGIAKLTATEGDAASTGALTKTGSVLGTPYYMSPEQAFGEKDVDYKTDVWAFGIILYECLTGRRPTEGDNLGQIFKIIATESIPAPRTLDASIPAEVDALVMLMLAKDRKARIASLADAREVLLRHAGHSQHISMPAVRVHTEAATAPTIRSEPPTAGTGPAGSAAVGPRTLSAVDVESAHRSPPKRVSPALIVAPLVIAFATIGIGGAMYVRGHRATIATTSAPREPEPNLGARPQDVATIAATSALVDAAAPSASSASTQPPRLASSLAQPAPSSRAASSAPAHVASVAAPAAPTSSAVVRPSGRGPGGLVGEPTF